MRAKTLAAGAILLLTLSCVGHVTGTPAIIVGLVVTPDGIPATNARVCVREQTIYRDGAPATLGLSGSYRFSAMTAWTHTDRKGILRIERDTEPAWLQPEIPGQRQLIWTASIWVPGYGATSPTVWILEPGHPCETQFALLATGNVAGRVVDERGLARDSVNVRVACDLPPGQQPPGIPFFDGWIVSAQSDRNGAFRIDGLAPNRYALSANASSSAQVISDSSPSEVTIEPGKTATPEILFIKDRVLRGRVVNATGASTLGELQYQAWRWHGSSASRFMTDEDGRFHLSLIETFAPPMVHSGPPRLPARLALWVLNWREGFVVPSVQEKIVGALYLDLTRELPEDSDIRLERAATLVFDVRDASARPVVSAHVWFFRPGQLHLGPHQSWSPELEQQSLELPCGSGSDRTWPRIEGVPPGEYEIYVKTGGGAGSLATVGGASRIVVKPDAVVHVDPMREAKRKDR